MLRRAEALVRPAINFGSQRFPRRDVPCVPSLASALVVRRSQHIPPVLRRAEALVRPAINFGSQRFPRRDVL